MDNYVYNRRKLEEIYRYSYENKTILSKVKKCGCFYCKTIFRVNEISDWINDKNNKTAMCPYCMIDSVIPESLNNEYELNDELLSELNDMYFNN